MHWTPKNDWYMESDAGYKICRHQMMDKTVYFAFAPRVNKLPVPLAHDIDPEPLKIICQKHFDKVDYRQ